MEFEPRSLYFPPELTVSKTHTEIPRVIQKEDFLIQQQIPSPNLLQICWILLLVSEKYCKMNNPKHSIEIKGFLYIEYCQRHISSDFPIKVALRYCMVRSFFKVKVNLYYRSFYLTSSYVTVQCYYLFFWSRTSVFTLSSRYISFFLPTIYISLARRFFLRISFQIYLYLRNPCIPIRHLLVGPSLAIPPPPRVSRCFVHWDKDTFGQSFSNGIRNRHATGLVIRGMSHKYLILRCFA